MVTRTLYTPVAAVNAHSSPVTFLEGAGHSWARGVAATNGNGYMEKLATILGLGTLGSKWWNYALGGAVLCCDQQPPTVGNGVVYMLQALPRANGGSPWAQSSNVAVIQYGANDLAMWGSGIPILTAIKAGMRTLLSRFRASATGVFEDNDPTVTLSGGWGTYAGALIASGIQVSYTSVNGSTVTIAVPSSFPGGTISVGTPSGEVYGGVWTSTIDGVASDTWDTRGLAPHVAGKAVGNILGNVHRFKNLAAGSHTIVLTVNSIATFAYFDYWEVEAPEPTTILVLNQPRLTAGGYADFGTVGDSDIQKLNVALASVISEFDDHVIPVQLDTLFKVNAALFDVPGDREHPNDAGHSLIAAACLRSLQQGPWLPALAAGS